MVPEIVIMDFSLESLSRWFLSELRGGRTLFKHLDIVTFLF